MPRARFAAALAVLAGVAFAGAERARFSLWTTSDEVPHVAAAREWRYGPGMVSNFEHPVLMKVIAGATLPAQKPGLEIDETRAGRAAFPLVLALLVVATGLLGRAVAGSVAGLAAAGVLAVEPTFRGHGTLVQSDVLLTLFLVAAACALERAARAGGRADGTSARPLWLAASGVLYGLAMASKYSAFPFLAVFAAVAALRLGSKSTGGFSLKVKRAGGPAEAAPAAPPRSPRSSPSKRKRRDVVQEAPSPRSSAPRTPLHLLRESLSSLPHVFLFVILPALVTLALVQFLAYAGTTDAAFRQGLRAAFEGLPQEGAVVALAKRFPRWIAGYGAGLLFVQGVAGPGERFNYFFGAVRGTGSFFYFPVALGIKLTAAAVLAVLAASGAAAVALFQRAVLRRLLVARASLPAALGGAYLLAACVSNVNIGVRHALPAVPFLLVAAAAAGRVLLATRPRVFRGAVAAILVLAAIESALRLGREISFGNLFVGGPAGVPPIISDSNVDWGQEQGLVFERVRGGDLGKVAMASLLVDETGATRAGIAGMALKPDAEADTVFFSRFLWDLAAAIEKNTDTYPKFVWLRGWLPPLRRGLEARATSITPFGDAYLLLRLGPATGVPSSRPGSTP